MSEPCAARRLGLRELTAEIIVHEEADAVADFEAFDCRPDLCDCADRCGLSDMECFWGTSSRLP